MDIEQSELASKQERPNGKDSSAVRKLMEMCVREAV